MFRLVVRCAVVLGAVVGISAFAAYESTPARLKIIQTGSDSSTFYVTSTLIVGPTEALLYDAQYHASDARRLADTIQQTGKKLKAIILSHGDHDHYAGAAIILERFPGTPVFMTPKALEWYRTHSQKDFDGERARRPGTLADSIVTPQLLPRNQFEIDGQMVEVLPDLAGDVLEASNTALWIPSLRTVVAGDIVFNNVHAWFGSSDTTSRRAWRASLDRLAGLRPTTVIAGHKKDMHAPDSPEILTEMARYIAAFDSIMSTSNNAREVRQALTAQYPERALPMLAVAGAVRAFGKPPAAAPTN